MYRLSMCPLKTEKNKLLIKSKIGALICGEEMFNVV